MSNLVKHPFIIFKNALTDKQCADIIRIGLSKMTLVSSNKGEDSIKARTLDQKQKINDTAVPMADVTYEDLQNKNFKHYVRDSSVSWLNDKFIYDMIHPFVQKANIDAGWGYQWDYSEQCQFTVYNEKQFYNWHADGGGDAHAACKPLRKISDGVYKELAWDFSKKELLKNEDGSYIERDAKMKEDGTPLGYCSENKNMWGKVRKLSVTVNLTNPENYEGGDLKFDLGPHRKEGRYKISNEARERGSIVVFPSHVFHQVTPVTKGTRYSLVMWNVGWPFI